MNNFWYDISIELIGAVLSAGLLILIGWTIYFCSDRRSLLRFFNIRSSKRLVIYLSNLKVLSGGSLGVDGIPRSYFGAAVVHGEQMVATKYRERFNYLLPSLSDSPSFLSKIVFSDIQVQVLPSPLTINEIESNCSFLSLGSPGYNKVSESIESDSTSIVRFVNDNRDIAVTGLPNINDAQKGFIQRIVKNANGSNRSLFYTAGLSERGTVGAAHYLVTNWKYLNKRFKPNQSFLIMLTFPTDNLDNFTIAFEKAI